MRLRSVLLAVLLSLAVGCQCTDYHGLVLDPGIAVLGDSIMNANADKCLNVTAQLGMLRGVKIRDFSTSGAYLSGGPVREIPSAYEEALSALPELHTVILDGGLNDLTNECLDAELPACWRATARIGWEVKRLLRHMLDAGASEVLYVGMYELKGDKAKYDPARASLMGSLRAWCERHGVTYLDTEPDFALHPEYYNKDGRHPNILGSAAIASLVNRALRAGD